MIEVCASCGLATDIDRHVCLNEYPPMSDTVYIACARYLERLGAAEYAALKARDKRKSTRYQPTPYHAQLVRLLGLRDENGFKSLKAIEGPYSALGF